MNSSNKLKNLEDKITNIKNKELTKHKVDFVNVKKRNDFKIAMNCMLEFTSGVLAGGIIGYGLDKLFDAHFVFFIIFVTLGFIAGLINLNRYLKRL